MGMTRHLLVAIAAVALSGGSSRRGGGRRRSGSRGQGFQDVLRLPFAASEREHERAQPRRNWGRKAGSLASFPRYSVALATRGSSGTLRPSMPGSPIPPASSRIT